MPSTCFIIIGAIIKAYTLVDVVRGVIIILDTARAASTMLDMTEGAAGMDATLKAGIPIGVDTT